MQDVSIDGHLAEIGRQILCPKLGHIFFDLCFLLCRDSEWDLNVSCSPTHIISQLPFFFQFEKELFLQQRQLREADCGLRAYVPAGGMPAVPDSQSHREQQDDC